MMDEREKKRAFWLIAYKLDSRFRLEAGQVAANQLSYVAVEGMVYGLRRIRRHLTSMAAGMRGGLGGGRKA